MVDADRVVRLVQRLGEQVGHLRDRAAEDPDVQVDEIRLSATKYRFVTAIEAVLDIAHHLLASQRWGPADTNADAIRLLGAHGVIDRALADRLATAPGFRNVLVHDYATVDDDRVLAHLDRIDDFVQFADQISAWVAGQSD